MADALKYRVIKVSTEPWVQATPASMAVTLNLSNNTQVVELLPTTSETFNPTSAASIEAYLTALHTGGPDDTLAAI